MDSVPLSSRKAIARMTQAEERDVPMALNAHLAELRDRLVVCLISVFIGFAACYAFAREIYALLLLPLKEILPAQGGELIFTSITEPFLVYLKTALVAGVFLSIPVIFLQLWLFIRPAFRGEEERFASAFVFFGSVLFMMGAFFGYFLVFPFGFKFLIAIGGTGMAPGSTVCALRA